MSHRLGNAMVIPSEGEARVEESPACERGAIGWGNAMVIPSEGEARVEESPAWRKDSSTARPPGAPLGMTFVSSRAPLSLKDQSAKVTLRPSEPAARRDVP